MTDKEKTNLVSITSKLDERKEEFKNDLIEMIQNLVKAIQDERLDELVLQWTEVVDEESDEDHVHKQSMILHWNSNESMDQTIGYTNRLLHRLLLIADGIIQG